MNDGSLNTIRKYIEFNAKENPHSDFVTCSHSNHKISNIQLKINLDKINIVQISNKLRLSKETTRRKILELEKDGVLIKLPKKNLKNILKNIRKKNIFISLRGETIRVSPSVYNKKEDVEKLFNCISKNT